MALPAGLCEPWDPIFNCELPTGSEAVSGTALQLASEVLYAMSGRQFSLCSTTLRPCRRSCYGTNWWGRNGGFWPEFGGSSYPYPALIRGQWYNLGCGSCSGDCSCTPVYEVALPGPVVDVTEVKVDGVVLATDAYRVDNWHLLVRLDGSDWPICNDLNEDDDQPGTWSVTFRSGRPVPSLGQVAVGQLTEQFVKLMLCDESCQLPFNVTSISRQGVDISILDPQDIFDNKRTGLYLPDLFISTYNPNGLRQRSRAYDIDSPFPRRTNT